MKPDEVLSLPLYQLRPLMEHLGALNANAQHDRVSAVLAGHAKDEDRRRYIRVLQVSMRSLRPQPAHAAPPIEHDPEKAAEWFRSQGIIVSNDG